MPIRDQAEGVVENSPTGENNRCESDDVLEPPLKLPHFRPGIVLQRHLIDVILTKGEDGYQLRTTPAQKMSVEDSAHSTMSCKVVLGVTAKDVGRSVMRDLV